MSFTLRASGSLGATVTALTVNLTNGTRNGFATFENLSDRIGVGGSFLERLRITSTNGTDLYTEISSIRVTYTDDSGVVGGMTSARGPIAPPASPGPTPPPGCAYALSPSTLTLGATGSLAKGTIQVTTTGSCSWSPTVTDSWLSVSPNSGNGAGSLTIAATDNITSNGANRTSRITVGGSTCTITQTGQASPAPAPAPSSCNLGPYTWGLQPQRSALS